MTIPDSQQFESYVPVFDTMPDTWDEAKVTLVEHLKKISNAVNLREIGWYLDEELLSGKQFYPPANASGTSEQYRSILRKVINFGPLPNTAIKTVAHGITVDANFTLMQIYAAATDPVAFLSIPIPYSSDVPTEPISLFMDATNVVITTARDWSNYTRCYVVIEYIQEL